MNSDGNVTTPVRTMTLLTLKIMLMTMMMRMSTVHVYLLRLSLVRPLTLMVDATEI